MQYTLLVTCGDPPPRRPIGFYALCALLAVVILLFVVALVLVANEGRYLDG
jgi:hypothetical protein